MALFKQSLQPLTDVLKEDIEYFAIIYHNNVKYFLCMGLENLFFLEQNFNRIKARIAYCHI
jgi:hypothetical protein